MVSVLERGIKQLTREGSSYLVDFQHPRVEDLAEFQERLKKTNGHAAILIHPFFSKELELFPPSEEYEVGRKTLVAESLSQKLPLIIFEEEKQCFLPRSGIFSEAGDRLYVVPTLKESPTPYIPDEKLSDIAVENSWREQAEVFRKAGIIRVLLGGRYLDFKRFNCRLDTENRREKILIKAALEGHAQARKLCLEGLMPTKCVGYAFLRMLDLGMDVTFSPVTSPSTIESKEMHSFKIL